MMKGRGASSCLICNDGQKVCIFNNISIIYGIRLLFDTHKYNIMLMSSKICIKCAGRLHQLFDFNLIKTNFDTQREITIMRSIEEVYCEFCDGESDLMSGMLVEEVKQAIELTKWSKDQRDTARCCYSCYNFLLLYAEVERVMEQECVNFYLNIRSWKVLLPDKFNDENVRDAQKLLLEYKQNDEDKMFERCKSENECDDNPSVQNPESFEVFEDLVDNNRISSEILNDDHAEIITENHFIEVTPSIPQDCNGNLTDTKSKTSLVRTRSASRATNETDDNLPSTKKRRSVSRTAEKKQLVNGEKMASNQTPITISLRNRNILFSDTPQATNIDLNLNASQPNTQEQESPESLTYSINFNASETNIIEKASQSMPPSFAHLTDTNYEHKSNRKRRATSRPLEYEKNHDFDEYLLNIEDKFTSIKRRRSSSRPIVLTPSNIRKKKLPVSKENMTDTCAIIENVTEKTNELPSATVPAELVFQEESLDGILGQDEEYYSQYFSTPIEPLYPEVSIVELDDTIFASEGFNLDTLPLENPSQENSSMNILISGTDNAETFIPNIDTSNKDSGFVPRLDITSEEILFKVYKLKNCSITMPRLDPDKLKKCVGKRMPASFMSAPKITKSGRIWKPKIIVDPSTDTFRKLFKNKKKTPVPKTKQIKIKMFKEKIKQPKRVKRSTTTTDHSYSLPGQFNEKTLTQNESVAEPLYFQTIENGTSNQAADITLEYPEEGISGEIEIGFANYANVQSITEDDDCRIVSVQQAHSNELIEMEFIASKLKHKGKIVFERNIVKLIHPRPRTVSAIC